MVKRQVVLAEEGAEVEARIQVEKEAGDSVNASGNNGSGSRRSSSSSSSIAEKAAAGGVQVGAKVKIGVDVLFLIKSK